MAVNSEVVSDKKLLGWCCYISVMYHRTNQMFSYLNDLLLK